MGGLSRALTLALPTAFVGCSILLGVDGLTGNPPLAVMAGRTLRRGAPEEFFGWNLDQARLYQEKDPAPAIFTSIALPMSGKWTRIGVGLTLFTS